MLFSKKENEPRRKDWISGMMMSKENGKYVGKSK